MRTKARIMKVLMLTAAAVFAFQNAEAQTDNKGTSANTPEVAKIIKAAADALGMPRRTDRAGGGRLPELDGINRMEFWGSGTTSDAGKADKASEATEFKAEYHVALSYNPPAMRVELSPQGERAAAASNHSIQTVRQQYAWDESELGAGLEPGRGVATPAMSVAKKRLLQLWILPYGVIKTAIAAGDKTKTSNENGATIITFPLMGELAGVTVRATLDAKNLVAKVETQTDNPALRDLIIEADYSDYTDHGEILSDVRSPGHIVEKQGGHTILDISVKNWDSNGPYVVFPVPDNVKKAATQEPAKAAQNR